MYTRVNLTQDDLDLLNEIGQTAQDFSGPADITRGDFDTWMSKWVDQIKPTFELIDDSPYYFDQQKPDD